MKIRDGIVSSAVLGLIFAQPFTLRAGEQKMELSGSGQWNADFGENYCRLNLALGNNASGSSFFALTMDPIPTHALVKVAVPAEKRRRSESGRADLFIDGAGSQEELYSYRYHADGHDIWAFSIDLDKAEIGQDLSVLEFHTDYDGVVSIALRDFGQAMTVMDQCLSDLHLQMGIDDAALDKMAVRPKGQIYEFIDLPSNYKSMKFSLLYTVGKDGGVSDCRVVTPSGNERFDGNVCERLEEKGKFEPALDIAGEPIAVPQYQQLSVRQVVSGI